MVTQKFSENIVILPFEWRFSKQNGVIRLKLNILPPQFFGWLHHCPFDALLTPCFVKKAMKHKI